MMQIDFLIPLIFVWDSMGKGSHGFHGKHETRLTQGRDYTDYNGFHEMGPLRDPHA